jgi:hypothetical protein
MRSLLVACFGILALTASLAGQSDDATAYSINTVKFALQMRSGGQRVIFTPTQRALVRLGDGVSIALLKLLNDQDLTNPETVKSFLSIIRDAFDQPQNIAIDVDRQPRVTLFLLNYLRLNVSDSEALRDIQQTIDFVSARAPK